MVPASNQGLQCAKLNTRVARLLERMSIPRQPVGTILLDETQQLVGDVRLERRLQVRDAAVLRCLVGFPASVGG